MCVLSGFGTAAVINLHSTGQDQDNVLITHVQGPMTTSVDSSDKLTEPKTPMSKTAPKDTSVEINQINSTACNTNNKPGKQRLTSESNDHESAFTTSTTTATSCSLCHLPYNKSSMNFQVRSFLFQVKKKNIILFKTFDLF